MLEPTSFTPSVHPVLINLPLPLLAALMNADIPDDAPPPDFPEMPLESGDMVAAWNAIDVSVLITDVRQRLLYVNPAFTHRTGYTLAEVYGRNPRLLQGPQTDPEARRALREGLARQEHLHQLILNYTKSGQPLWFDMHVSPVFQGGVLRYWVGVQEDVSSQVETQRRTEWTSAHDSLTGLRNRHGLEVQLSVYVESALRRGESFALLVLDLDGFKTVNDVHGHAEGDRVLRAVADALRLHTRASDQLFRLGGDEFMVVLSNSGENAAQSFAQRLLETLAAVEVGDLPVRASLGLALFPQDGQDMEALVHLADQRMYRDKTALERGRARKEPPGT